MTDNPKTFRESWRVFRPSKFLWLWTSAGMAIATVTVGFGWGGWVTAETAQHMVDKAAQRARARLVADVCVQRYIQGTNFTGRFAELKGAVTLKREDLIQDGKWTDLPGVEPVANAARLCANELTGMNIPNNPAVERTDNGLDLAG